VLNEELTCGVTEHGGVVGVEVVGFTRLIRLGAKHGGASKNKREDEGANQRSFGS